MFGDSFVSVCCIGMSCLFSSPSLHTRNEQPLFCEIQIVCHFLELVLAVAASVFVMKHEVSS